MMPTLISVSPTSSVALVATGLLLWAGLLAIYRRYFHPLAGIPGPAVPALSRLCLWWHNSQSHKFIEECHTRYGPVVRIAPDEVHLSDPDNYETLYSVGYKFNKDPAFYMGFRGDTIFNVVSPEEHRHARAPLNPFFSRRAVLDQEDIIWGKVDKLCRRLYEARESGAVVDMHSGFRAVSIDVLSEYAYDDCWNLLDRQDLGIGWTHLFRTLGSIMHMVVQFPTIVLFMSRVMPVRIAALLNPVFEELDKWLTKCHRDVLKVKKDMDHGIKPRRATVFHDMIDNDIKNWGRLGDEAFALMGAASDTVGNALTMTAFNVTTNKQVLAELSKELYEAYPDSNIQMKFNDLEKLPYLTGVIKEGLRLSYGAISRLPRRVPKGGATFNGYYLPEHTIVGMSSWMMHRDPRAFLDPDKFDPTRWTFKDELSSWREHCLVPFSSGSRACIGQVLSKVELYCTIAAIFRRFEKLETWNVGPEDMVYEDSFAALQPRTARRFQVVVG